MAKKTPDQPARRQRGRVPTVEHARAATESGRGIFHVHAALLTISLCSLLIGLDGMMVNLALPHIRADLDAGSEVSWIVTAYFLGAIAALPAMGWIAARWGTRGPYLFSIAGVGAMSVLSALAPNLPLLVVSRLLVGLVGSPAIPMTMTIVTTIYPQNRRGRAMAIWGASGIVGPALGPTLGGRLADTVSWHVLFLFTLPMMVGAFFLSKAFVPDVRPGGRDRLDAIGIVLGPAGLAGVLLGLTQGRTWGWTSPTTLTMLIGGSVALVMFVWHDLYARDPLLDLRLMRVRGFPLGSFLAAAMLAMVTARLLFIPLELDQVRGFKTTKIGGLLAPAAIATAVALFIGGRAADRVGPRRPLMAGSLLSILSNLVLARWTPHTSEAVMVAGVCFHGFSTGLFMSTAMVTTLWQVPAERMAQASTLRQIVLQTGAALSSAILSAVLGARLSGAVSPDEIQAAYSVLFVLLSALAAVAFLLTWRIPHGVLTAPAAPTDAISTPADVVAT